MSHRSLFTTGQLAKIFVVAPRTIGKWIDSGKLKGYRLPSSKDRRVTRADAVAFAREHKFPQWMIAALENQEAKGPLKLPKDYGTTQEAA